MKPMSTRRLVVCPSGCKPKDLVRLRVLAHSVRTHAPSWSVRILLSGCTSTFPSDDPLLTWATVTYHPLPPSLARGPDFRGFVLKPWLLTQGIAREVYAGDLVHVVDSDELLLSAGRDEEVPLAPLYNFGVNWVMAFCVSTSLDLCPNMTHAQLKKVILHGVPYVLRGDHFKRVAAIWYDTMLRVVHTWGRFRLEADQQAYALAAVRANVTHRVTPNIMLSTPSLTTDEAWSRIESGPCDELHFRNLPEPLYIHTCQWYSACASGEAWPCARMEDAWHFHKGKVPTDLFRCDAPLLEPPPIDLLIKQKTPVGRNAAFVVCAAIHMYNRAAMSQCSSRSMSIRIRRTGLSNSNQRLAVLRPRNKQSQ